MKIEVTAAQVEAIKGVRNDIESMVGGGDSGKDWNKWILLIDRMLIKNNLNS